MKKDRQAARRRSYTIVVRRSNWKEIVAVVIYFSTLIFLLPLKYDNTRAKTFLYPLIWVSVGFALYKALFERSREKLAIQKIGAVGVFLIFLYYFIQFIGFCGWSDQGVIYTNKKDPSLEITARAYSCMLTDDDAEFYKERKLSKHLKWATPLDEKIDTAIWQSTRGRNR